MKYLLLLTIIGLSGCLYEQPEQETETHVINWTHYENTLVISGYIRKGYFDAVTDLIDSHSPEIVYISTGGGSLNEASMVGNYYQQSNIQFAVFGKCNSACHVMMAPLHPKASNNGKRYILEMGFHRSDGGNDVDEKMCQHLNLFFDARYACDLIFSTPNHSMSYANIDDLIEDQYLSGHIKPPKKTDYKKLTYEG